MAWQATLDSIREINGRCIIDATVEETEKQKVYPYHAEYDDPGQMTLVQVRTDVLNFAKEKASAGNAIDVLRAHEGETFPLNVE